MENWEILCIFFMGYNPREDVSTYYILLNIDYWKGNKRSII